jgi:ferritin-like metal-binding protein YciE
MATQKTLDDLFLDTLKDIFSAEKQILKTLPKMARAAQSQDGKAGFLQHRDETQESTQLGLRDAIPLLKQSLAEEEATDKKLTQLAVAAANAKAA